MKIRRAKVTDIPEIHKLINKFSAKKLMLPRSLGELYEQVQNFFVLEQNKKIIGSCSIQVAWEDLAEIKSLAVEQAFRQKGYGALLVKRCHGEARQLGVKKIFVLTFVPGFFKKQGYTEISKDKLPQKVWTECIRCPLFPDCNEVPLMKYL